MTRTPQTDRSDPGALWHIVIDRQPAPAPVSRLRDRLGWLASCIVHAVIFVVLGLWVTDADRLKETRLDIASGIVDEEEVENLDPEALDSPQISVEVAGSDALAPVLDDDQMEPEIPSFGDLSLRAELSELSDTASATEDLLSEIGALDIKPLQGRSQAARADLVRKGGGTEGSELAVALALAWLAEHQNRDGSWTFQHHRGPCKGRCGNPGDIAPSVNGATALALLPFLGAGQTHLEGKYRRTVGRGINYLLRANKASRDGSLMDAGGQMYSHGLAAIALSEVYAMTKDRRFRVSAQRALDFTVFAQDPRGGGWRYQPRDQGDTSAVGWQIMALKSGQMAELNVPEETLRRANLFLDFVQQENGAFYGYMSPGTQRKSGLTAIGLLCRMYLGWDRDNEALRRGIAWFDRKGPAENDFYANYYTMQLMFHYTGAEGPTWNVWNAAMRDRLVDSQETEGHMRGSWYRPGGSTGSNTKGGRLYCTAMAAMTLEVYYRHMPIYRDVLSSDAGEGRPNAQ